ncbi:MAG: CcmD family protein [Chloroflexota bacterium]|nr:CcmD family protein [Chloroflexota bacterium]
MIGRALLRTALGALLACGALATGAVVLAAPLGQESGGGSNMGYLFAGFAVVWVGVIVYLFSISKRDQSLRRELDDVRQRVADREKEAQP